MWPMQEWSGLSSQDLAEAEQLKVLTHPAGGGTLTALKMSSAELLQFCAPLPSTSEAPALMGILLQAHHQPGKFTAGRSPADG